ncbi:MAG: PA domain-containing protein, partial [Chloracidobacterium sp.]
LPPDRMQVGAATGPAASRENAQGSTFVIRNTNEPGVGFNDPTPAAPVGGNPGTTLGQQRLNVFQRAAEIWGATLRSNVPIVIAGQFTSLPSNVLGSAGTTAIFRNFPNAPLTDTWHHYALANALASQDLSVQDPPRSQINTNFSTNFNFYLGLDNNAPPDQVDLLTVVLHEFSHGLGFSTFVNTANGRNNGASDTDPNGGFTDCYARLLRDENLNLNWNQMTADQRQASAINTGNLTWTGSTTQSALPLTLDPAPVLRVERTPPEFIAVNQASFGGAITLGGLTRPLVAAQPPLACGPLSNPGAVNTNFALVDRGDCPFVDKAANAQQAGAQGLIIANNFAGGFSPGGTAPNITIPVVGISQADGATLRNFLSSGSVTATLLLDPTRPAGTTNGRIRMFAPNPRQAGSSVSHWDSTVRPRLLMEPAITPRLPRTQDLTLNLFRDIGWTVNPIFSAPGVGLPASGSGMPQSVTINATGAWTVSGIPDWVTGFPAAGNLLTTVSFQVAANPGAQRTATLTLSPGGNTFTITQSGSADVAPTITSSPNVTLTPGQPSSFLITASGVPTPTITLVGGTLPPGITFTGGDGSAVLVGTPPAGTTGVFLLSIQATNGTGVANQTLTVTVQAGACAFTVTPTSINVGGDAVSNATLTITTGPTCAWEARVRNIDAPWIKLISAQLASGQVITPRMVANLGDEARRLAISGIGNATLTFAVGRNPGATPRAGTFFVAGQFVTVTQAGSSGPGAPIGSTMAMFRPSNGFMYLKNRLISDFADNDFFYGLAGDTPIAGDWNGDGVDTPGIYRNVNGTMTFFLINNNTGGFADVSFAFGGVGDVPIAGDWDGNGTVTCGVYRPSAQTFFLRNTNTAGNPDLTVVITGAQAMDVPIAGQWTVSSNVTGLGLYRPGTGQFFLKNANVSGPADATFTVTTSGTVVRPVAGDWTRQGFAAVGVVVNLNGTIQFQLRTSNTSGPPDIRVNYGVPGDVPLIGNWDGQPKPPPVSVP